MKLNPGLLIVLKYQGEPKGNANKEKENDGFVMSVSSISYAFSNKDAAWIEAVDAPWLPRKISSIHETSIDAPRNAAIDIDDHLSLLCSDFQRNLWDSGPDFTSSSPIVSHSREVEEIPTVVSHGTEQSFNSVFTPTIDGFSGTSHAVAPEIHGAGITDGIISIALSGYLDQQRQSRIEDVELEEVVSWSLKTAEQEKALRGLGKKVGASELDTYKSNVLGFHKKRDYLGWKLEAHVPNMKLQMCKSSHWSGTGAGMCLLPRLTLPQKLSVAILIPGDLFTARIRSQLAANEASFSQELTSDDENELTLQVRMPNGNRNSRRFAKSDKLQSVFDFIDVGGSVKPDSYSLVRPYPRLYQQGRSHISGVD
ncbi:hypothetical protein Vadar_014735 [Vaccinium darrowii]|uniref:Uncharacterized protein n=1 Tax=Vaccinium darrowii TaxID=229202 RepID=A0ACB7ZCQ6_9ERIC|nr:hypothetical protein Vadar_014735 [Vaccinium darrowii]